MKDFENYECEGQMSLDEMYPKPCCGLTPWLHKSKCWMDGREDIAQLWLMHYVCPKCLKAPVDKDGWIIRTRGTFEEAKAEALKKWNDPNIKKDCHLKETENQLRITIAEINEWEQLYGDKVDYVGRRKHE